MGALARLAIAVALVLAPSGILAQAHSGAVDAPGIEPSDIALAAAAAFGLWLARRSMRARAAARRRPED